MRRKGRRTNGAHRNAPENFRAAGFIIPHPALFSLPEGETATRAFHHAKSRASFDARRKVCRRARQAAYFHRIDFSLPNRLSAESAYPNGQATLQGGYQHLP